MKQILMCCETFITADSATFQCVVGMPIAYLCMEAICWKMID